jgi:hypothetical protein
VRARHWSLRQSPVTDAVDESFREERREIERREVMLEKQEITRIIRGIICRDENQVMAFDAYMFATRQTEATEAQLGAKHGVSNHVFCSRVKQWQDLFALPSLGAMMSEKGCNGYDEVTTKLWLRRTKLGMATLNNRVS